VAIDSWLTIATIENGRIFRCIARCGTVWGSGITEKVVWWVVREHAELAGIENLALHDLRRYAVSRTMPSHRSELRGQAVRIVSSICFAIFRTWPLTTFRSVLVDVSIDAGVSFTVIDSLTEASAWVISMRPV
jgi:hypothetical protein